MCAKASLFLLFLCFFVHASIALPNPLSHTRRKLSAASKEKLEFDKFISLNGRDRNEHSIPSRSSTQELCKKNKAIKEGKNRSDCKSSLRRALLQLKKPEDSRWPQLNVREMDLQYSSIFSRQDFSETDYQPPHRKSPIHNK